MLSLAGLFVLVVAVVPAGAHAAERYAIPIMENLTLNRTLRLEGPRWNGAVVRNVTIRGVDGDGIVIRNVDGVRIENCVISNVAGNGIKLSIHGSTRNVHLVGNRIAKTGLDGISAGQRHARGVDHPGLVVRDNRIERTGLAHRGGRNHGIYVQASDFLIEGNYVSESLDGNGISVRSSGIVRGNVVRGSAKSGIAYYSDHMRGPSDLLVIEGNRVSESGRQQERADIDLLNVPEPAMTVRKFHIRDNEVSSIRIHPDYAALGIRPSLTANRRVGCGGQQECSPVSFGG